MEAAGSFVVTLALVGAVIVIAALLSGLIERSGLPQVAAFLALGAAFGAPGLGLLDVTLDSPILRVVATVSLLLVLFTDAVSLDVRDLRRHLGLAFLVLGPGTLLSAALIAVAAWWLAGLGLTQAAILGAALASTDPVMLRGALRRRTLPDPVRQALALESGLNDAALLPVVLVAMAIAGGGQGSGGMDFGPFALRLFVLGPAAGVVVGLLGIAVLDLVRRRIGVRRDYESLYSLGIAFAAYAAAEAVHGSGFLAAFAAGLTIAAVDVELCDCFIEYGETTSEMALLFTFVLFGSSLIWSGFSVADGRILLFALVALLARLAAFLLALSPSGLDWRSRFLIAWLGPRGLSSLLLVLLPVFAGQSEGPHLFALCCLVVLLSVAVHGGSLMLVGRAVGERRPTAAGDRVPDVAAPPVPGDSIRITLGEVERLERAGEPVVVIDARSDRSYQASPDKARGAIRLEPDRAVEKAGEMALPKDAWLVVLCA